MELCQSLIKHEVPKVSRNKLSKTSYLLRVSYIAFRTILPTPNVVLFTSVSLEKFGDSREAAHLSANVPHLKRTASTLSLQFTKSTASHLSYVDVHIELAETNTVLWYVSDYYNS